MIVVRRWIWLPSGPPRSSASAAAWAAVEYHMNDIAAAMGHAQLEVFDAAQARRQSLNRLYRTQLANVPGHTLLEEKTDRVSGCWLFTIRVERRLEFIHALKSRGVEVAVCHQRIDRNSLFGGERPDLPNQALFNEAKCLFHYAIH